MIRQVGVVAAIHRYPVKSMAGEQVESATLRWACIDGDRQYAFYKAADRSRFPWATARTLPDMLRYRPRYVDPGDPRHSPVLVTTPDGTELDIGDPALVAALSDAAGEEIRLMQIGRGVFDDMPISVLTTTLSERIAASHGRPVDPRRFRPNIMIDTSGGPFTEAGWAGGQLMFGEGPNTPRLGVANLIQRCVLITIDPDTQEKDPKLMRLVAQAFGNEIGAYCSVARPGTIKVGDPVFFAQDL